MLGKLKIIVVMLVLAGTLVFQHSPTTSASVVRISVNGIALTPDTPPLIQNGRVLIPMRAIFEALGAAVHWDKDTGTIRAYRREDAVVLQLGSRTAWVNGPPVQLDVAPMVVGGRTMVPLRFVSEALGADVHWVETARTVQVQYAPYSPKPIGGTLTLGLTADPVLLNPLFGTDTPSVIIHSETNWGLVRSGADLEMRNSIADRWMWDAESMSWTFWLRPDIKFSDGRPVTARDVKFTFDTIMHPDYDGPRRHVVEHVQEVIASGDHVVQFRMRQIDAPFLFNIGFGIIPHHILGGVPTREHRAHPFNRQPIGAGPYLLERIVPGQFSVLQRNPHFWMAPRPYIGRIVIRRYGDINVMQAAFEAGDIDWLTMGADAAKRAQQTMVATANFREIPQHAYTYMALNLENPILADRRVREALKVSLNRPAMVGSILNNAGIVVNAHQLPTSWASGARNLNTYAYDPAEARQLLDQSGWRVPAGSRDGIRRRGGSPEGEPLRLSIMWNTGFTIRQDVATMATRHWREIGVDATDLPTEWSVMLNRFSRGQFDVVVHGWTLGLDPDPFAFFHSSQAVVGSTGMITGLNRVQIRHVELDRLLEAGRGTVDLRERRNIYHRVDQILNHELPYIWLFQSTVTRGVRTRIRGIIESPIGTAINEARYIVSR